MKIRVEEIASVRRQNGRTASLRLRLKILLRYTVTSYTLVLYGLWGMQWALNDIDPYVGWIRSTFYLLTLPTVLLLPLSIYLRLGWWTKALIPPMLTFLLVYGVFFIPRAHPPAEDDSEVSILTFNIQIPENENIRPIVAVIEESEADIVAIQELSQAAADEMGAALAAQYPYQALHPQEYAPAGQGLLSRYPILEESYWSYTEYDWSFGHQRVVLDIHGAPLVLFNTHPVPFYTLARGLRVDYHLLVLLDVMERTLAETLPVVLLGDFNITDQSHIYRQISDHYTDAYRAVGKIGFGFTYPADNRWLPPFVRLDFIFYSEEWTGVSAEAWPHSGGSDHAPVLARLILPQGR
ncbi:MAG: endonuclease/exonuclease/phosphatase family protein [Caldilineaceae bacterium]|nr:endonuclease/exonuclease/phosphatase family protein [Caldilineaceae bacterium]